MVVHTKSTKPIKASEIKRNWHLIDVKGKVLGRVATEIATRLIGKHKTNYVDYLDMGDYVVVTHAPDVVVTGKKEEDKLYARYSGYPGGLKKKTYAEIKKTKPEEIIRHAIYGMLPKNKLRDRRIARLYIYKDEKHPHEEKFDHKLPK